MELFYTSSQLHQLNWFSWLDFPTYERCKYLVVARCPRYIHRSPKHWLFQDCSSPSSIPVILSSRMRHHNDKRSRCNNVSRTLPPLVRDVTYSLRCETHMPLRHKFDLLNTHSLANKGTLLNYIIAEKKLDILLLTETWQLPNDFMELSLLTPPGYYH